MLLQLHLFYLCCCNCDYQYGCSCSSQNAAVLLMTDPLSTRLGFMKENKKQKTNTIFKVQLYLLLSLNPGAWIFGPDVIGFSRLRFVLIICFQDLNS